MPAFMKPVNTISRCQAIFRNRKIDVEDLRPSHYPFILTICRNPGLSQDAIARNIFFDKSTVARVLAYLEKTGYVTRTACEKDKRRSLVYPTEKMLTIYPQVRAANGEWNEKLIQNISETDLAVFERVLLQMEQRAKEILETLEDV